MPDQWEYLGRAFKVSMGYEDILNEKGSVGWELVCTIPHPDPLQHIAIFKRPKGQTSNEATNDIPHRCHQILITPGADQELGYFNLTDEPKNGYHYIRFDDKAFRIDYCPWCGEKL